VKNTANPERSEEKGSMEENFHGGEDDTTGRIRRHGELVGW
jgi:hypothetical protein